MNVFEAFCGAAGGWGLGLERAGHKVVAACEIDPWRREQYARRFPHVRLYGDIAGLSARQLARDGVPPIQLFAGSPPCQDASTANTRGRGLDGERTGLFLPAIRLAADLGCDWVLLENVPGLVARGIDRVLLELGAEGYTARLFNVGAIHAGAAHWRKRLWIVADRAQGRLADARLHARPRPDRARAANACRHPPRIDADRGEERVRGRVQPGRWIGTDRTEAPAPDCIAERHASDRGGAGLAEREGECGDARPELAAFERDLRAHLGWRADRWNGGLPSFHRVAHGLPRGVAKACIAAYGDAVMPQLAEAWGRAVAEAETQLGGLLEIERLTA